MKHLHMASDIVLLLYLVFLISAISNAAYNISLGLLFIISLIIYCKENVRNSMPKPLLMAVLLFVLPLLVSAAVKSDMPGLLLSLKYGQYALAAFVLYYVLAYQFSKNVLTGGTLISVCCVAGFSIYKFLTTPLGERISGIVSHANHLAYLLAVPFCFLLFFLVDELKAQNKDTSKKWNIAGLSIGMLMGCSAILFSQSRGGITGVTVGVVAVGFLLLLVCRLKESKKVFAAFFLGITLLGIGSYGAVHKYVARDYDNERTLLVISSYNMWQDHKLLGVGMKNWQKEYKAKYISPKAKEPNLDMPHCVPAYFFSTTGLVGGLGYVAFVVFVLCYLVKKLIENPQNPYLRGMLAGFIYINVHGMVDSGFTNKYLQFIFWSYLGITLASVEHYKSLIGKKVGE